MRGSAPRLGHGLCRVLCATMAAVLAAGGFWTLALGAQAGQRTGFDVSWPDCGSKLPWPQAFAIVGVNRGRPNTVNPCFKAELRWAKGSSGASSQPAVALYLNTSDPGDAGSIFWPKNNADPITGAVIRDPYGKCKGENDRACAWQFGWNAAERGAHVRGVGNPTDYDWWLDVEISNTWESNQANNRADLGGMVSFFDANRMQVGVYSTSYQWNQIVGSVPKKSRLNGLADWLGAFSTRAQARANCHDAPFSPGGSLVLTQWYVSETSRDHDYAC